MSLALINVPTNDGTIKPLFCLGTVFLRLDEMEPTSGRILLCEAKQATPSLIGLNQVVSHEVSGCVYSVSEVKGMLAAAVNSSVRIEHFLYLLYLQFISYRLRFLYIA